MYQRLLSFPDDFGMDNTELTFPPAEWTQLKKNEPNALVVTMANLTHSKIQMGKCLTCTNKAGSKDNNKMFSSLQPRAFLKTLFF